MPERLGLAAPGRAASGVAVRVQWLDPPALAAAGGHTEKLIDRVHLDIQSAPSVGDDGVLDPALSERDRLGRLREEVDRRRAPEPNALGRHAGLQRTPALRALECGHEEHELHATPRLRPEPGVAEAP